MEKIYSLLFTIAFAYVSYISTKKENPLPFRLIGLFSWLLPVSTLLSFYSVDTANSLLYLSMMPFLACWGIAIVNLYYTFINKAPRNKIRFINYSFIAAVANISLFLLFVIRGFIRALSEDVSILRGLLGVVFIFVVIYGLTLLCLIKYRQGELRTIRERNTYP